MHFHKHITNKRFIMNLDQISFVLKIETLAFQLFKMKNNDFKVFNSKKICAQQNIFQTIKTFLIMGEISLLTFQILVIIFYFFFALSQIVTYPPFSLDYSTLKNKSNHLRYTCFLRSLRINFSFFWNLNKLRQKK